MSAAPHADPDQLFGLSRANLREHTVELLNRGRWGNPDVLLVRAGGGSLVVKDYLPRSRLVRETIGRVATARELGIYRALAGHPAVPRIAGRIDAFAFAVEYRPGRRMSRKLAGAVPASFVAELTTAVDDLHARGIVHLDLRHRSNVLCDAKGHPVLLDFATALRFRRRGLGARLLLPLLRSLDRGALRKWRVRLAQPPAPAGGRAPASDAAGATSEGGRGASRPT